MKELENTDRLKFIGTEGGFSTKYGTNAAYVMVDGKMVLFDCGETTRMDMDIQGILEAEKPQSMDIVITHFHSDHFGSLGNTVLRNHILLPKVTRIIFPNKEKVRILMQDIMEMPDVYWNSDKTRGKILYYIKSPEEIKEYNLKAYKAVHGLTDLDFKLIPMEAYSYLFKDDKSSFFYSGDTEIIPLEIITMFLNREIDHMYLEAQRENWAGHLPLSISEALIPEERRPDTTLMHLSNKFDTGYAKKLSFKTAR